MSLNYLPADLPENWQTGQILSPTGTEVGFSEQHGYNYLMKAVNEAHNACNLLLDDNQKLREELGRKAPIGTCVEYELAPSIQINDGWILYAKNPFGYVTVSIHIRMAAPISGATVLGQLPDGFYQRKRRMGFPAIITQGQDLAADVVYFDVNGNIDLIDRATGATWVHCLAGFFV